MTGIFRCVVRVPASIYDEKRVAKLSILEKQSSRGVLGKRCSEYMQQNYRRIPMAKCDFNKVALQLQWSYFSKEHLWRAASDFRCLRGSWLSLWYWSSMSYVSCIYLLKVSNRNTRKKCEICSKLTIKTPEWRQWRPSGVFIIKFEHTSHLVLVFLLLTLNI